MEKAKRDKELRSAKEMMLKEDMAKENEEKKRKTIEEMKRKIAEDKLEMLKKTPLGARAFADVTAAVSIWLLWQHVLGYYDNMYWF